MPARTKIVEIEQRFGKPIRLILQEQYRIHGKQTSVAAALGVSQPTLSQWLIRLGLEEKTVLVTRHKHTE